MSDKRRLSRAGFQLAPLRAIKTPGEDNDEVQGTRHLMATQGRRHRDEVYKLAALRCPGCRAPIGAVFAYGPDDGEAALVWTDLQRTTEQIRAPERVSWLIDQHTRPLRITADCHRCGRHHLESGELHDRLTAAIPRVTSNEKPLNVRMRPE